MMSEQDGKRTFARLLLQQPGDPFGCAKALAYSVGIYDAAQISSIGQYWPHDPTVIEEKARLLDEEGEEAFLPSKIDVARQLWMVATGGTIAAEDKLKALKEYSELMGYKVKEAPVSVNVMNVMQVPVLGSDEEWEQRAAKQQRTLIEHVG